MSESKQRAKAKIDNKQITLGTLAESINILNQINLNDRITEYQYSYNKVLKTSDKTKSKQLLKECTDKLKLDFDRYTLTSEVAIRDGYAVDYQQEIFQLLTAYDLELDKIDIVLARYKAEWDEAKEEREYLAKCEEQAELDYYAKPEKPTSEHRKMLNSLGMTDEMIDKDYYIKYENYLYRTMKKE